MPNASRKPRRHSVEAGFLAGTRRAALPHEFVLDRLAPLTPTTRPMFGCLAVYVQDQIVVILRDRPTSPADNGVWLATTTEHHASLQREFPHMRSIRVLGKEVTQWQVLAVDAPDFEQAALRACVLILGRDPRIGKVPKRRKTSLPRKKASRSRGAAGA